MKDCRRLVSLVHLNFEMEKREPRIDIFISNLISALYFIQNYYNTAREKTATATLHHVNGFW